MRLASRQAQLYSKFRLVLAPFFSKHLDNQRPCSSPSLDRLPSFHRCLDDNDDVPLISTARQTHTLRHSLPRSLVVSRRSCACPISKIAAFVKADSKLASLHHAVDSGKAATRASPSSGLCASGRSQQNQVDLFSIYIDCTSRLEGHLHNTNTTSQLFTINMRHSALLTSALAVGGLALPQGQLEKRQQVTVFNTVTVTVTVFANPAATPAWAGPPKLPNPPNPNRPPFAPSLPVWTPPRPDAGRTSSNAAGGVGVPPAVRTSSSTTLRLSSTPTPTPSRAPTPPVVGLPGATQAPGAGGAAPSSVVGSAISNAPVPSNAAPTPAPGGAPIDPGHTPGAGQAALSVGLAYQNAILYHHNAARANHNAAPLVWNQTVANTAAVAANTCRFEHLIPAGAGQGQNLFTVSGANFNVTAGITESWYKGEFQAMLPLFGQASIPDTIFHDVGHLTQVLWKGTTSVGCVSIDCGNRMVVGTQTGSSLNKYTVCNYYPAGNVGNQYAINVGRPISTTNLGSWLN